MMIVRAMTTVAALALCASLAACSGAGQPQGAEPTAGAPTASTAPSTAPSTPVSTDLDGDEPIAKVVRAGQKGAPTSSAKPASTTGKVAYSDGVVLAITTVTFAKEKENQGPGSFPGREYARLTVTLKNGSKKAIDLDTVVPTLLDAHGASLAKVYANEAQVKDFSGVLKPGRTATAVYAFAVSDTRARVTVVVDFDSVHTSAVFRGELS